MTAMNIREYFKNLQQHRRQYYQGLKLAAIMNESEQEILVSCVNLFQFVDTLITSRKQGESTPLCLKEKKGSDFELDEEEYKEILDLNLQQLKNLEYLIIINLYIKTVDPFFERVFDVVSKERKELVCSLSMRRECLDTLDKLFDEANKTEMDEIEKAILKETREEFFSGGFIAETCNEEQGSYAIAYVTLLKIAMEKAQNLIPTLPDENLQAITDTFHESDIFGLYMKMISYTIHHLYRNKTLNGILLKDLESEIIKNYLAAFPTKIIEIVLSYYDDNETLINAHLSELHEDFIQAVSQLENIDTSPVCDVRASEQTDSSAVEENMKVAEDSNEQTDSNAVEENMKDAEESNEQTDSNAVEENMKDAEESNDELPSALATRQRIRDSLLQNVACKKILKDCSADGINDAQFLKYILFGYGKRPTRPIIIKRGKKGLFIGFILYAIGFKVPFEVWNYLNDKLRYENDEQALFENLGGDKKSNPTSTGHNFLKKKENFFQNSFKANFQQGVPDNLLKQIE